MTRHEAGQAPVLIAPDQLSDWLHRHLPQTGRLTADSRRVRSGDAFFALRGARHDGTAYIAQALAAGARAIVLDAGDELPSSLGALPVPVCQVPALRAQLGLVAAAYYGHPTEALSLVAVTGTNGKTSVTHWVADGFNQVMADDKAVVVGTNGAGVPGALQPIGMTTPDGLTIQDLFRRYVDEGVQVAAIEASSIGLEQGRLEGCAIQTAVFTNLSRDHLDYHGSMQAYAESKCELFAWPGLEAAVINLDDALAPALLDTTTENAAEPYCLGYLIHDENRQLPAEALDPETGMPKTLVRALTLADACDEVLMAVSLAPGQWVLTLMSAADEEVEAEGGPQAAATPAGGVQRSVDLSLQVLGRFNLANALAVAGVWRAMGWSLEDIAEQLALLRPVPGRMENIAVPGGASEAELAALPLVVVDYAHTPDALENTLGALRELATQRGGRLWCVFGAGGDRDPGKRPQMATVAERLADAVVLTSDNPRSEDPHQILDDIQAGLTRLPWLVQENRADAIDAAVQAASAQDVVLVAGKGREATQEVAGVFHPFSDPGVVGEALLRRLNRAILPGEADV